MKLFKPLYEKALSWSSHPRAEPILGGLSFVEAIIFPVMPEIMLGPMVLARPQKWARFATVSMVFSVLGALVGYALGHFAFAAVRPLLDSLGWLGAHRCAGGRIAGHCDAKPMVGVLDTGVGRILAYSLEDIHLGLGHRRRSLAAIRGKHADRARQARVPVGRD
jgi:hypothetical protein